MKIAIIGLLGLSLLAAQAFAAEETADKTVSRSFTVEPGGELNVDSDRGDIEVLTANQNTVDIVVERQVNGGSPGQAESVLKSHHLAFTHDGNTVRVEAALSKPRGFSFRTRPDLSVHFRITVPRRFNATLNTAGGHIDATGLHGNVDARTTGGDLVFTKIEGAVDGQTSGGNVRAVGCTDKLQIQSSGGNIVIKDFSGPSATVDTSGGNVDVNACSGKLQIKTSGGNIDIEGFSGPGTYVDTSGGAITFGLDTQPLNDCWFHTSGGNITARLPENAAMNLIAVTDGGIVSTAIPVTSTVQGKVKEGHLEGKLNGGGPVLTLRTSGGNIQLLKK